MPLKFCSVTYKTAKLKTFSLSTAVPVTNFISHFMDADIGRFAHSTVMRAVMHSVDRKVFWREKELDRAQLVVE